VEPYLPTNVDAGLKAVITDDGVWRIRKCENVPVLEVFKLEETGHGDILSPVFIEWRLHGLSQLQQQQQQQQQQQPALPAQAQDQGHTFNVSGVES